MFSKMRSAKGSRDHEREEESDSGTLDYLTTVLESSSASAEAYRTLRTNLFYTRPDNPPRVVVVTSSSPGEGKSTVCANLGVVLAQAGKSTLILDCDLRKPMAHRIFGLRNFRGVGDVLSGEHVPEDLWKEPLPGLKVMSAGPVPPNPAEILGSGRFAEFLAQMRRKFEYVLIDTPPVGAVSDAVILAAQSDGTLLVLDAQSTRKGALRQGLRSLQAVGADVVGTIMNFADAPKEGYYYHGHAYK